MTEPSIDRVGLSIVEDDHPLIASVSDIERALAQNALAWLLRVRHRLDDRARDLVSVARDSCEVCVIRRVPPVDGEHSGELANPLHRVVVTHGDEVGPGWDNADLIDVSPSRRARGKHIAWLRKSPSARRP